MTSFDGLGLETAEVRQAALLAGAVNVFGQLTEPEQAMIRAGLRDAMYTGDGNQPEVRGSVISWLLMTPEAVALLPRRRLLLENITVTGGIQLDGADTEPSLLLWRTKVLGDVCLRVARLGGITLNKVQLGEDGSGQIDARRCSTRADFEVAGCKAKTATFEGATIRGNLACSGSTFTNPGSLAFNAVGTDIHGGVFLGSGSHFLGEVRLLNTKIGAHFSCRGGTLSNKAHIALALDGAEIGNGVLLGKSSYDGEVRLTGSVIGGQVTCEEGKFSNPGGAALLVDLVDVRGGIFLDRGAQFDGEVKLSGAKIAGPLVCEGSRFTNPGGLALSADDVQAATVTLGASFEGQVTLIRAAIGGDLVAGPTHCHCRQPDGYALDAAGATIGGSVVLEGPARFEGEVRLLAISVGRQVTCRNSLFRNPGGTALSADAAQIGAGFFADGNARFEGRLVLTGAVIRGPLSCEGATVDAPGGYALVAHQTNIAGGVSLNNGGTFNGLVEFTAAEIRGPLSCRGSKFHNPGADALRLDGTRISSHALLDQAIVTGRLSLKRTSFPGGLWLDPSGTDGLEEIDLTDGSISTLHLSSDPQIRINLTGTEYARLEPGAGALPTTVQALLTKWRQEPHVPAHTYAQLASALRGAGYEREATRAMVEWHNQRARGARWPSQVILRSFGLAMRYGYAPFRPLAIAAFLALVGTFLMLVATGEGVVASPHNTTRWLGSIVTGIGALIPLDTLFLEPASQMTSPRGWDNVLYNLVWGWYWLESVAGWVLAAIAVAGLANVVRRA